MQMGRLLFWRVAAVGLALSLACAAVARDRGEASIDQLKARVTDAKVVHRPQLCIHIAERQLQAADKNYVAGDSERAKADLTDVVAFAGLARDYAIESHKHEKPSEITIRKMIRKLADLKHTVSQEDQAEMQKTIDQLEQIRDDLLKAMFPKVDKR
ncbi:MAG: hypothetical protein WBX38_22275 [Candidatus Sulfotelmatobacter sp.]